VHLVGFAVEIADRNLVDKNQLAISFERPNDDNIKNSISF